MSLDGGRGGSRVGTKLSGHRGPHPVRVRRHGGTPRGGALGWAEKQARMLGQSLPGGRRLLAGMLHLRYGRSSDQSLSDYFDFLAIKT